MLDAYRAEEISVGDYVLSGGEPAAMILLDSIIRLLDGTFRKVPDVLPSGNHGKVAEWRKAEAEKITKERRPDLWAAYETKN